LREVDAKELRAALMGEIPDAAASAAVKAEIQAAARGRGNNAEAYRLYLQANFHHDRFTPEDSGIAIEAYLDALKLDPNYALAWAGLSIAYAHAAGHGWPGTVLDEGFHLAREAAGKAMQLAPDLAEAHEALGVIRYSMIGLGKVQRRHSPALELAPGNVHHSQWVELLLGWLDEAIAPCGSGESDPLSGQSIANSQGYLAGDGLTKRRVPLELGPRVGFTHVRHSEICLWQGRLDAALEAAKREIHDTFRLLALANAYHAKGRHAESDAALEELIETYADRGAFQIAEAFAYRDDSDQAFAWLERAYAQRDAGMDLVRASRLMRSLHGDPRWLPFLEKVGLAD
jgi:hypothetical protein